MGKNNHRNSYLDVSKGIITFLMLWGHCIQCMMPSGLIFFDNPIFKIIYSFHMPCFALISGYFLYYSLHNKEFHSSLGKRVTTLIQAIVMGCMVNSLISYLPKIIFEFSMINLKLLLEGIFALDSLWFLWSTLISCVAIAIAVKASEKVYIQFLWLVLFVPLLCFMTVNRHLNLFMYPYFILGYYFCKYKDTIVIQKMIKLKWITIPAFITMLPFFQRSHYIYTTGMFRSWSHFLEIDIFRYAVGLVGSISFLCIVFVFVKFFEKRGAFYFGFDKLGTKSLQTYVLTYSTLNFYLSKISTKVYHACPTIQNFFYNNQALYSLVITLAVAILYSIGTYLFIRILEKLKISKVIFGR